MAGMIWKEEMKSLQFEPICKWPEEGKNQRKLTVVRI